MVQDARRLTLAAAAIAFLAGSTLAQQDRGGLTAPSEPTTQEAPSFSWSSPALEEFASAISGAWRSSQPVQARGSDESLPVYVFVSPIGVEGLSDTLYIESAPADSPGEPFRQSIAQLREGQNGAVRLRTYEIGGEGFRKMLEGAWVLETPVPLIGVENLVPTMDITLRRQRDGYSGQTEHPYPTRIGDAETMTSEIRLSGDRLTLADRGLNARGDVVWGPAKGKEGAAFQRTEPPIQRQERENGLVIIDIGESDAPTVEAGDSIFADYAGWTGQNGLFDSSFYPGRQPLGAPRGVVIPEEGQPGQLIAGWNQGMLGAQLDARRFLIIPGDLGYGPQGNPRAGIEPNATLYFAVEPVQITKPNGQVLREGVPTPEAPEPENAEGAQAEQPAE